LNLADAENRGDAGPASSLAPLLMKVVSSKSLETETLMTTEAIKNLAAAAQSFATIISFIIGGIWVYRRYIRQQENYPNIEFKADINRIGTQGEWWILELIAMIENKGKVQHKMEEFRFDLNGLYPEDQIEVSERWGGQIDFPRKLGEGSFLPAKSNFFFIDPGTRAKYSYVARVPKATSFLILHCWFKYADRRKYGHTAEKTLDLSAGTWTTGASQ
jgi:hypothetical protein